MQPLVYGYIRVSDDLQDSEVCRLECDVRALASLRGFRVGAIFSEYQPGYFGEFYALMAELKRTHARHVIVPSLDHLSRHPMIQVRLLMQLKRDARAWLWVVRSASTVEMEAWGG